MKKFIKLIPALAMLLIATTLVSTATFAWFSMNDTVKATNMQVKAVAERGLLINEVSTYDDTHWDEEATAAQTGTAVSKLYPSSTTDANTWYHAKSKKSASAADATSGTASNDLVAAYESLTGLTAISAQSETTAAGGTKAAFSTMGESATAEAGYYVHYTYYLKGTTGQAVTLGTNANDMNVYIKSVTAEIIGAGAENASASANLNKAIRVGIRMKTNGNLYIYAPVEGFDDSYFVNAGTTATVPIAANTATATDLTSLPAAGSAGTPVEVYIWYEGEDVNCKSDNALAAALDDIKLEIAFELKAVPTT